ncbi:hypothetical protein IKG60_00340 [Candidatus Saccharibacteria bacterium]|nr:hypothetical protein [Candidatus Saccharibacteria bacterium]
MYPNQNPNVNNPEYPQAYPPANSYYQNQSYQTYQQQTPENSSNNRLSLIIIVILAVFAIGGIAFGAIIFINSSQEIAKLNDTISTQEIAISQNTTLDPTTDGSPSDYIYVGEWGVKIKIPAELSWVGYSFSPSNTTSTIAVYGAKGQFDTRPSFLNFPESTGGFGYVTRAPIGYGSVGGIKIFSSGGYDYFYEILQQANTDDTEEAALEASSKALIEAMLTTPDNYSPI